MRPRPRIKSIKEIENSKDKNFSRYDFSGMNLIGVDFRNFNLCDTIFSMANLNGADFTDVNLNGAILCFASLEYAKFINANLQDSIIMHSDVDEAIFTKACLINVYLTNSSLRQADFTYADLKNADLGYTNLLGARFDSANLKGVNLLNADIDSNNFEKAINIPFIPYVCPEFGSFIGYKKTYCYQRCFYDACVIKLKILKNAKRLSGLGRKCRCNRAKVLEIQNLNGSKADTDTAYSIYDNSFVYKVGEIVSVDDFDEHRWNECSTGIHFFINRQEAVNWRV